MTKDIEDNKLVMLSCAGDAYAFEMLLNRHYKTIFRIAYKWCGHQENAEDITQNVCIKLSRAIHSYKKKSTFTSWLYRIVINSAIDWQRSHKNHNDHKNTEDEHLSSTASSPEGDLYMKEIMTQINDLPEKEKTALLLTSSEGLSHKEVSVIMECKESTVSWYIHEARKKLTNTLDIKENHKTGNKKEQGHG